MNRYCTFFCAGIWPFLLGPLLLLLPLLFFQWHSIENLVAANAQAKLAEQHSWAVAETYNRGRDVLVTGSAPSQDSVDQALSAANNAEGVRSVNFVGDIVVPDTPPEPAKISALMVNGDIVLRGTVDSQATIDEITSAAQQRVTAQQQGVVRNELSLGSNISAPPMIIGALAALTQIDQRGAVELIGDQLTLKGQVSGDIEKNRLGQLAARGFGGEINNQLVVVEPPCQLAISALLENSKINFASGQAVIQDSSESLLQQIAGAAKECQEAEFEVSGHTDSTGSEATNLTLSEARANAVVAKLAELGLARERFIARGAGAEEPVADNANNAGRAANRRIEFRVTN